MASLCPAPKITTPWQRTRPDCLSGLRRGEERGACAEPAPTGTHGATELPRPTHIDEEAVVGQLMCCAGEIEAAVHGFEYGGGADQPWRHSVDKPPVTDR